MSEDSWSIILIIGVSSWIVSSVMFMLKAFPERNIFDGRAAMRWGIAFTVSFSVWIIGLLNA